MEREGGSRQSFSSIMWEDTTIKEEVTTPNCLDDSSFVNTDHLQEGYNGMMRFHSHHPLEKNMESIITSYERQGGLVDSSSHSSYMVMPSFTNYLREGLQMGEEDYSRSLDLITSSHQDMGCSNSQREMVPSTPNSSVSSSSSEGQVIPTSSSQGHQATGSCSSSSIIAEEPPPEAPPASKKQTRKKGQKRSREPRFAFMTKSQVDHLEDGYRWRKYGQKAVKNSPYPRSYYRCTNSKCSVKKRVERSCEDPEIVITTYEGQHCHHSPASMLRGAPPPLHHLTSHLSTEFQQHQQDLQILMSTQHRTLDNNDNPNNPYSSLAPTMEMNNNIYRELASQYISQRLLSSQQSVMMPTPSADMVGSGPPHSSSAHNGLTQSHLNTRGTGPLTRGLPPSMDHGLLEDILKRM